ncbi:hypothetical protein KIN20_009953 [Parelaphostrongylus tenuis]|uniref:Uncharacterized protein n=1 Tax=Parelaphostrongylus tenuis TaxID=148309 RepID=A0AAD5MT95_PARTN|nr:hypothetical protein KIN20_009953 [Parelaphostrongylus tenuis]
MEQMTKDVDSFQIDTGSLSQHSCYRDCPNSARTPRFRISISPPRRKDDLKSRRFEMRVAGSSKYARDDQICEVQKEDNGGTTRLSLHQNSFGSSQKNSTDDGSSNDNRRKTTQTTYV